MSASSVSDAATTMQRVFGVTGKALCFTSLPTVFCIWRRITGNAEDYRPLIIYCIRRHTDLTSFVLCVQLPRGSYCIRICVSHCVQPFSTGTSRNQQRPQPGNWWLQGHSHCFSCSFVFSKACLETLLVY